MGGLLLLGVLLVWLAAVVWLARRISRATKLRPPLRTVVTSAVGIVIFFLPVADELASKPYFAWLCHHGAVLNIDQDKVRGRRVWLRVEPRGEPVSGALIPILRSHFTYRDTVTGAVLVQHDVYRAEGGLLARFVGFLGSHPLTGTFYCAPPNEVSMQSEYDFVIVN